MHNQCIQHSSDRSHHPCDHRLAFILHKLVRAHIHVNIFDFILISIWHESNFDLIWNQVNALQHQITFHELCKNLFHTRSYSPPTSTMHVAFIFPHIKRIRIIVKCSWELLRVDAFEHQITFQSGTYIFRISVLHFIFFQKSDLM